MPGNGGHRYDEDWRADAESGGDRSGHRRQRHGGDLIPEPVADHDATDMPTIPRATPATAGVGGPAVR
jgi:hypothetical protein